MASLYGVMARTMSTTLLRRNRWILVTGIRSQSLTGIWIRTVRTVCRTGLSTIT